MKGVKIIFSVFYHSLKEQCKNKLFAVLIIFSLFFIYATLLVGIMAVDQESKVLIDFGLGLMEIIALVYIVYASATTITDEFKSKTIYLILSRPVPKTAYLAGKILSLFSLAAVILIFSGIFHLILLKSRGYDLPFAYYEILLFMWMKLVIISSITVLLSFISTSVITTAIIAIILWAIGHFAPETKFLIEKSEGLSKVILEFSSLIIPNFQIYNLRDYYDAGVKTNVGSFNAVAYLFAWVFMTFSFSSLIFRKKQF